MIRIVYNVLFLLFFCLSAPFYFLKMLRRGNWRGGFGQRFGFYSREFRERLRDKRVLWLHAVSVGEVNVCTELIRELEPRLPGFQLIVSTTTSTGMARLREELPGHVAKVYYPIDLFWIVNRALRALHPSAVILIEAEIWPNLLWRLQRDNIPAMVVNARLSDRSYHGYRKHGWLFRRLFASFAYIGAQNESDAERLREIGYAEGAVAVPGALKFDAARPPAEPRLDAGRLLERCGMKANAPVLVGGSTHDGEEALLARIAQNLRKQFPDLFLVLAPRHMERRGQVSAALRRLEVPFQLRSRMDHATEAPPDCQCLVVDTTGELVDFYRQATIVFVGKSLTAKGGQNPIEPGALGKAMIFGPNMQNFRAVARAFVAGGAARQVPDEAELERALSELLADRRACASMGEMALRAVAENQGAVARTVDGVLARLRQTGALRESNPPT